MLSIFSCFKVVESLNAGVLERQLQMPVFVGQQSFWNLFLFVPVETALAYFK